MYVCKFVYILTAINKVKQIPFEIHAFISKFVQITKYLFKFLCNFNLLYTNCINNKIF